MTLRQQNAARARTALLAAAHTEFLQHGYEGTSMRDIASAAGVSTGTLFNYFANKLELLHRVQHADLEEAVAQAKNVERTGPLTDQLNAIVRILLTHFAAQPDLSRTLLKGSLFATGPAGEDFKTQIHHMAGDVQYRIEAAIKRGELDVNPSIATLSFVSVYYLCLIICLTDEHPDVEHCVHLFSLQIRALFQV